MKEAHAVIEQIQEILKEKSNDRLIQQSDIGVVTPYRLQCKIIGILCRRLGFSEITIGTAEVFQGQEKPVMIVSTVRTGGILGFVNSAQVRLCGYVFACFFIYFFQFTIPENQRCVDKSQMFANYYWRSTHALYRCELALSARILPAKQFFCSIAR